MLATWQVCSNSIHGYLVLLPPVSLIPAFILVKSKRYDLLSRVMKFSLTIIKGNRKI